MAELLNSIIFQTDFKQIPSEILNIIGLIPFTYSDSEKHSINKIITQILGFNFFQVIGIFGLAFLSR